LSAIDLIPVFTIAFLGAFGHCIGMCGGIVIAYSSSRLDAGWGRGRQALAHLLYSLGRTQTYTLLGVLFGYLGGVTTFSNTANGVLLIVAGVAMVLAGLSLGGRFPALAALAAPVSESRWYSGLFRALLKDNSLFSLYFLGLLNGLLPCGFVYFFAITAASTGSPLWGGLVMMVFGLSTLPALFSLGFFVNLFQRGGLRRRMVQLAAVSVVLYGAYTAYSGYEYLTDPSKTILDCHAE
jgi:uncharacterized protein